MSTDGRVHDEHPVRLLVITAHPDDAEFAIGGSVGRWVREGTVAHLVCCTSGDAGGEDASADPLEFAALRETEQRTAASTVGYDGVTFLHRPDGALANDLALREQLVRVIRSFRPDAVAAPDPRVIVHEAGFIQHVDHRAAGLAALDAVYPAALHPMAFPHLVTTEGLAPHTVKRLYLFWSEKPSAFVDISATLELKIAALRAHASQHDDADGLGERVRAWARDAGEAIGLEAAESFTVIDLGRG
jgi:LmbE family N-acetylglucosaminyl deacetylase